MKKILTLIIGITLSLSAMSQEVSLDNIVRINLPKGSEKVSTETARSMLKNKKKSEIDVKKGVYYKIDNAFLKFVVAQGNAPENYLENLKKSNKEIVKLSPPKNYSSVIKSINNYKVLIVQYDKDDLSYYRFFSISNDKKSALNGVAEFSTSTKKKNLIDLEKMLESIEFK